MNNKFLKNTISLFSGTMMGQLLIVLSSPILTRIYTLEQFGQLAIFTSILSIFLNTLSFRYEMAFINIENDKSKLTLLKMLFIFILFTSSLLAGLLLILDALSILSYFENYYIYFLLWASLIGIGLYNALSHYAISDNRINSISISKLQQSATLVVVQLISGVFNIKNGLILGDSISRISGLLVLFKTLTKKDYKYIFNANYQDIFFLLKKYKNYAKFSVFSGVTNNFVMQSLPLILAIFYAQPLIGILTIIQRVLVVPIKLISQSIRQAYMNEIMTHIRKKNYNKIKKVVCKIVFILSAISIIPFLFAIFYGEKLLVFILGSNLEGSTLIINALLILSVFQFIFIPISQTLEFLEQQRIQFQWQVLRFFIVLITLILFPILEFSFTFVLYVYVCVMSLFYVLLFILVITQLDKTQQFSGKGRNNIG